MKLATIFGSTSSTRRSCAVSIAGAALVATFSTRGAAAWMLSCHAFSTRGWSHSRNASTLGVPHSLACTAASLAWSASWVAALCAVAAACAACSFSFSVSIDSSVSLTESLAERVRVMRAPRGRRPTGRMCGCDAFPPTLPPPRPRRETSPRTGRARVSWEDGAHVRNPPHDRR
ncbi:Uncharacterised protein [Mycobacteroides abscessus]|nr:Uncharacterised protein [Mycobacteroides abscessus]